MSFLMPCTQISTDETAVTTREITAIDLFRGICKTVSSCNSNGKCDVTRLSVDGTYG